MTYCHRTSMPCPDETTDSGPPYVRPLASARSGRRRRIEAFSPKIGRRVSLWSYTSYRVWIAAEANPQISSLCEHPARIDGPHSPLIDFWVQFRGRGAGEFWIIRSDDPSSDPQGLAALPPKLQGLPVRAIHEQELAVWATAIANWASILPHLVMWRRFRDPLLEQRIAVYLGRPRTLDSLLDQFADQDAPAVEAALFSLVAGGRVVSPDLERAPLSGATAFWRA